jgi:hypothetical protein
MDRLIIETILADVDEILLSGDNSNTEVNPCILLGYKASNIDQIIHAFSELKKLLANHEVSFLICKTMVHGMYDLEIASDALDEPVRIANKVIEQDTLQQIEQFIEKSPEIKLAINVSQEENWIHVDRAEVRTC